MSERRNLGTIRTEFAIWIVLLILAVPAGTSQAALGNWGLVSTSNPVGGPVCLWARAQSRVPSSSGARLDFNAFGYKQPNTSCNHSSPWAFQYASVEQGVRAELWASNFSALCSDTSAYIIPPGSPGSGWGIGRAYNPAGICSKTTSFIVVAWSAQSAGNYAQYSNATFTA